MNPVFGTGLKTRDQESKNLQGGNKGWSNPLIDFKQFSKLFLVSCFPFTYQEKILRKLRNDKKDEPLSFLFCCGNFCGYGTFSTLYLRNEVRFKKNIEGNLVNDFVISYILGPCVLLQANSELDEEQDA